MTRSWHPPVPQQGAAERWRHDGWKPTQPRRSDTAHLEPSGEVGNGGGTTATSGQSPAASVVAARSCVETNDPVQRHSITPITTPFTPGTTRLAAGSWPLEAHTATTLRHSSPRTVWRSRQRWRHHGYQRPVASSQPGCGALMCRDERPGAVALHHAHHHAIHTRHNQAGRWPLAAGSPHSHDAPTQLTSGEVGNGGGTTATSGQSPAASLVAARSCVETNDPVQWHSITPITTPFTPGTTGLAADRWPLEAHTATTLRRISPRPIWQWHSSTPITTPFTPGTTRLAAGSWPLEAPTATTLRRISPRPIWQWHSITPITTPFTPATTRLTADR